MPESILVPLLGAVDHFIKLEFFIKLFFLTFFFEAAFGTIAVSLGVVFALRYVE